jgi:hypothetical protein
MIAPCALFFIFLSTTFGKVLHLSSLPPVAVEMLPYIGIAVLFSVLINTAAGVALACKKMVAATSYSLLVIGSSVLLGMRQDCDVLGIAQTLTALMALSSVVGLLFIYRLRTLPARGDQPAAASGSADASAPSAP